MDPEKERKKNEVVNKVRELLDKYLVENCENSDTISAEILFPGDEQPYIVGSTRYTGPSNN